MKDHDIIDQSRLAEDVSNSIKYDFLDFFLVKPLDPVKVKKEFSKPISKGTSKDADGIEANDFDSVEIEVREVDSDYRKGVVLKRPAYLDNVKDADRTPVCDIKIGDVVVFRDLVGLRFDLIKDSRLLKPYDILGIEKTV